MKILRGICPDGTDCFNFSDEHFQLFDHFSPELVVGSQKNSSFEKLQCGHGVYCTQMDNKQHCELFNHNFKSQNNTSVSRSKTIPSSGKQNNYTKEKKQLEFYELQNKINELEFIKKQMKEKKNLSTEDYREIGMIEKQITDKTIQISKIFSEESSDETFDHNTERDFVENKEFVFDEFDGEKVQPNHHHFTQPQELNQNYFNLFSTSTPAKPKSSANDFSQFFTPKKEKNQEGNNLSSQKEFKSNDFSQFFAKEEPKIQTTFVEKTRCSSFEDCKLCDDKEHKTKFYHKCRFDERGCLHIKKVEHINNFLHICPNGEKCKDKDKVHQTLFIHTKSKVPKNLKTFNFLEVDKSTLIPHSKTWKRSSSISVTLPQHGKFEFLGFESISPVDIDNNSVILFKETGKGIFNGYLKKVKISEIEIPKDKIAQPWDNKKILIVKHEAISKKMNSVLNKKVNGLEATFLEVISFIHSNGIPVFIVGGCIRDLISDVKNKTDTEIKDIDLGFGCSANELVSILKPKYQKVGVSSTGLVSIGDVVKGKLYLEGKSLNGFNNDRIKHPIKSIPSSIGTDLFHENICRDFTCNALWYDCINETIIDPTGYGIEDVLNLKLRIPVSNWKFWFQGNPTKLMRYMKMKAKGYSAIDLETEKFILENFNNTNIQQMRVRDQFRFLSTSEKPLVKSLIISLVGKTFWDNYFAPFGF
jgi:hypothetical protein